MSDRRWVFIAQLAVLASACQLASGLDELEADGLPLPAAASGSALSGYEWSYAESKQVVYMDRRGHVHMLRRGREDVDWIHADLTAVAGAKRGASDSGLSGYGWTIGRSNQIVHLDADGHVQELYLEPGREWQSADLIRTTESTLSTPAAAGSALSGYEWVAKDLKSVVYLGVDAHIHELYILYGVSPWSHGDLTSLAKALPAAPGTPLKAYVWPAAESRQVGYLDPDGHVHELRISAQAGWADFDLTQSTDSPPAAGDSKLSGYVWTAGDSKQWVYLDVDGHVHELSASLDGTWTHTDLTVEAKAPAAMSGSALSGYDWPAEDSKQVAYLDGQGHIHELRMKRGGRWRHADLTSSEAAPPAARDSDLTGYVWTAGRSSQLAYLDANGQLRELVFHASD